MRLSIYSLLLSANAIASGGGHESSGSGLAALLGDHTLQVVASAIFAIAVLHTFSVKRFQHLATFYRSGSVGENLFHLLGEVEVVFGFWAGVLVVLLAVLMGASSPIIYLESLDFTEPMFVFVIMAVAATRPVVQFASALISLAASFIPLPKEMAFIFSALVLGPLLGSFITEPAAMTVTALILKQRMFDRPTIPVSLKYAALGTLFVNVSIGGVLTPFAAPPVLMVAGKWGWEGAFMLQHFGWKASIAVVVNAVLLTAFGWKSLGALTPEVKATEEGLMPVPWWLIGLHLVFLAFVVMTSHHATVFMGIFLFFLGVVAVTEEYQEDVKLKESLLVGFFLGGLVVLGTMQRWWLQPILVSLDELPLFLGATALTAITDNAALTYLGSQVEGLSDALKYALVAGAVSGGGLTVIANAPNPAGYSILQKSFGEEGISPIGLLLAALVPTVCAMTALWLLP